MTEAQLSSKSLPHSSARFPDPWPYAALALFFALSTLLRPLIATAETRYLSVAWEMVLRKNYFLMTLNFEPYYHKPPLFFWLIAGAWEIFGVHRSVATALLFLIASLAVFLTTRLATTMFPDSPGIEKRTPWMVVGSVAFLSYASLIYLDVLQAVLVLGFTLCVIAFARSGRHWRAAAAGLFLGLGILAKGPVMIVHVIWPVILYPLWKDPNGGLSLRSFYQGCATIIAVSLVPVACWLGPLVAKADPDFLYNLLWRQTVERVSGSLDGAHPQPVWFYLMLLPIVILPWGIAPDLLKTKPWRAMRQIASPQSSDMRMLRLLVLWLAGVFVTLSVVSGKQPHYLIPAVPLLMIVFAYFLRDSRLTRIRNTALAMIALFVAGQAIAAATVFDRLNLVPLASFMKERENADWAYAGRYQGEFNYLARLRRPVSVIAQADAESWLCAHPEGYAIIKSRTPLPSSEGIVFSQPANNGAYYVLSAASACPVQ
ncbi:MAG: glycosyltransferase family 39 protein [Rhizobiaceae bacterium]|nr:glycosyltransferase family 39 protein [Rhizobiaceae bacterium]